MRWLWRRRQGTGRPRRGWLSFFAAFWPFMLGSVLVAGGLAAIVIGYIGVAGTLVVGLQLPYVVSGGLLGIALVVLGSALIVLHALNRQATLTRRLLEELRVSEGGPVSTGTARGDGASEAGDGVVVATRGGRLFHRPGCTLVVGKEVRRLKPGGPATRRLSPCRLCDPSSAP